MKIRNFSIAFILGGMWFSANAVQAVVPDLVPVPRQASWEEKSMKLGSGTSIGFADRESREPGLYFADKLRQGTGWTVPEKKNWKDAVIRLKVTPDSLKPQAYNLRVTAGKIDLTAGSPAALVSGLQTLLQMMPPDIYAQGKKDSIQIPCGTVTDYPETGHRGISLDVSRHFQDKDTVLKLLDGLAACKINSFQWHLTDDQGWRFPSKAYPKLTEKGPSYSVQDIKDVVLRARQLGIRIIPEVDMPGHSHAVTKAYPELGTQKEDGKMSNVLNVGKPEVYAFAETIIKEVNELIPGEYFHMGADEVNRGVWKKDPACQELMKKEKLANVHELQAYFTKRIASLLRKHHRKPIAWDEALDGGLGEEKDIVILSWHSSEPGRRALAQGHPIIWSPGAGLYFDKVNSRSKKQPRGYGNHVLPLHRVYSFCPQPPVISKGERKNIMGAQAGLWAEVITGPDHMFMMVFPRICALGEALWSPAENKDWASFVRRMDTMKKRLDAMKINYFWEEESMPLTIGSWSPEQVKTPKSEIVIPLAASQIDRPGYYEFNASHTGGDAMVKVHSMELLDASGKVLSRDEHDMIPGLLSRSASESCYYVNVEKPGDYKLKITLSPEGEGDSHGQFQMIRPLPEEECAAPYSLEKEGNRNKQPGK